MYTDGIIIVNTNLKEAGFTIVDTSDDVLNQPDESNLEKRWWFKLTEEQEAFRVQYPEATTEEVIQCKFIDPIDKMSREELLTAHRNYINAFVDKQILSDFIWNGIPVWLSGENQTNYKAAYDLAFQAKMLGMDFTPIRFKFGITDDPVYHTFESFEELADFYVKAVQYVQACLENGWDDKDGYNNDTDEELRKKLKTL